MAVSAGEPVTNVLIAVATS